MGSKTVFDNGSVLEMNFCYDVCQLTTDVAKISPYEQSRSQGVAVVERASSTSERPIFRRLSNKIVVDGQA